MTSQYLRGRRPASRHRSAADSPGPSPTPWRRALFVRGKWLLTTLGLVLAVVLALGVRLATNGGHLGGAPAASTHDIAYRATSTGRNVIVTYTSGGDGVAGQEIGPSPWSADVSVVGNVAFITVGSGGGAEDSVTCSILDRTTGRSLVRDAVGTAGDGTVTCVLDNLDSVRKG